MGIRIKGLKQTGRQMSTRDTRHVGLLACSEGEYILQRLEDEKRERREKQDAAKEKRRKSVSLPVIHFGEVK